MLGRLLKMNAVHYQLLPVILGISLAALAANVSPLSWAAAIPWFDLYFLGVIGTILFVFLIGTGARTTQTN